MRVRIARIAAAIALAAAGVVASTQGMVTASLARDRDGSAPFSPNRTAGGHTSAALRALTAGNFAAALAPARQSLGKRPLDAPTMRILAAAQIATDDAPGAARSLTLGSQLGWRDPGMQLLLFQVARDSGDVDAAALRFDALARQRVRVEELKGVMREFLLDPGAPQALAQRLTIDPLWRREYLQATDPVTEDAYRPWLDMLVAMKRAGAAPRRLEYSAFERTLVHFGKIPLAIEASSKVGALSKDMADGFGGLVQGEGISPFAWSVAPGREASVSQAEKGSVSVTSDGQTGGALVQRLFPVSAGAHRLTLRLDEASGDAQAAFRWTVSCLPLGGDLEPGVSEARDARGARIQTLAFVAPAGCQAARIALTTVPGRIRGDYSLSVSDLKLD